MVHAGAIRLQGEEGVGAGARAGEGHGVAPPADGALSESVRSPATSETGLHVSDSGSCSGLVEEDL